MNNTPPQNQELKPCKLKPCKCSGEAYIDPSQCAVWYYVRCRKCSESIRRKNRTTAIKAWNKRANDSNQAIAEDSVNGNIWAGKKIKELEEQLAEANRQLQEKEIEIAVAKNGLRLNLDRDKDSKETLNQLVAVALNGIYWRNRELEEARKAIAVLREALQAHHNNLKIISPDYEETETFLRTEAALAPTACQDYVKRSALDLANKELKMVCDSRNKIQIELDLRNFSLRQVETKLAAALKVVEATKGFQSAMRQHKEEHATLVHLNQVLESFDVIQNDYQPS